MKRAVLAGVCLASLSAMLYTPLAAEADEEHLHAMMVRKLGHTEQVLGGMARGDFEAIGRAAKELEQIGREQWLRSEHPGYLAQLKFYRFACEELGRLAGDKNLDGVTVAYVQLTLSCVNCHKELRRE